MTGLDGSDVGEVPDAVPLGWIGMLASPLESIHAEVGVHMATKDKGGGKASKKQAQHDLKQKRQAKKAKKAGK